MITYTIVATITIIFLLIISKANKGIAKHDNFLTQIKFIQMYRGDDTQKVFYNKEVDDAMTLGQDMLWEATKDFNERMHKAIVMGQPFLYEDMGIIMASIKIIKVAEAMVYIKNNGPIHYDNKIEQHSDEVGS